MKQHLLLVLILILFSCRALAQNESDRSQITRVYEEADRLFRARNYAASLDYLKKEGGTYLNSSDSLQYLRIRNLEYLYKTRFEYTQELEASLKQFYNKVNRYTFPELKYDDVTRIYSVLTDFKDRDKAFYDSVSRVMDLNNVAALPAIRTVTSNYLATNPNTYYNKELNNYIGGITSTLDTYAEKQRKHALDSTYRRHMKEVGKRLTMSLSYGVPSGGTPFTGMNSSADVESFFNGTYKGGMGEKYIVGASLGDAFINIYSGTRAKIGISWSIFDGEYTAFDWSTNSYLNDKESNGSPIENLQSIKAGTRLGPVIAFLVTKKIAVAAYYSARPGIQFLMHSSYYSTTNVATTTPYQVKPVIANYNMSSEVGLRIYFFERLFISPYFHFGNYTWQNDIINLSAGGGDPRRVKTNYEFKNIGLRIGF